MCFFFVYRLAGHCREVVCTLPRHCLADPISRDRNAVPVARSKLSKRPPSQALSAAACHSLHCKIMDSRSGEGCDRLVGRAVLELHRDRACAGSCCYCTMCCVG